MAAESVLLLTNQDMEGLLEMPECIDAVERAFRKRGVGTALPADLFVTRRGERVYAP